VGELAALRTAQARAERRGWVEAQAGKGTERAAPAGGVGGDVEMGEAGAAGGESEAFKARVIGVLESNQMDGARSSKLTQDDFLRLLSLFNAEGIHFA
jgi:hypothetical protein